MKNSARLPIFKERFEELFKLKCPGGNITEFSKILALSRQTVGFYLNGDRVPDAITLLKICSKCNVPSDWLIGKTSEPVTNPEVRSICDYTGLSASTISFLHITSYEKVHRAFYRNLFDSLIRSENDNLDDVPEYVLEAARAHVLAENEAVSPKNEIENIINSISREGNAYKISASDAEDFFLMEAQALLSKSLAEVIGNMEHEAINQIKAIGRIDSASLWVVEDDGDYQPLFSENKGEEEIHHGEHPED